MGSCLAFFEGGLRPPSFLEQAYGFALCYVLVSCLVAGARIVSCESLVVGSVSCTFCRWPSATFFLIGIWFCFVFCVGFLFSSWGMSCTLSESSGCGCVLYFLKVAFGHLLFNRHMVLLCVMCWFLVYQLGHELYVYICVYMYLLYKNIYIYICVYTYMYTFTFIYIYIYLCILGLLSELGLVVRFVGCSALCSVSCESLVVGGASCIF